MANSTVFNNQPDSVIVEEQSDGKKTVYSYFQGNFTISRYTEDGLSSAYSYRNGLVHGVCIDYYSNGNIKLLTTYVNGIQNGSRIEFFPNGKPSIVGIVDSQRKGDIRETIRYDENTGENTIVTERSLHWDRTGLWYFFDESGAVVNVQSYD